jgi:Transposase DDE domain group 1
MASTTSGRPEQHLILALLRPGTSPAKLGAIPRLRRMFQKLRAAFPGVRLRVRLDGGFAGDDVLRFLEAEGVEYVVALGKNRRLEKRVRRLMGRARMLAKTSGQTEHLFGETRYAARRWQAPRRVIMKAEVVRQPDRDPKNNPRFVVTNLPHTPEHVYTIYRQRGDVENRIKELKAGLALDRLSCSRFLGNQFRLLLTAAAYILVQALRQHAAGTSCATAQATTLRERLVKVAVWVTQSVRRIVLHFPTSFPWQPEWWQIACAVGARP